MKNHHYYSLFLLLFSWAFFAFLAPYQMQYADGVQTFVYCGDFLLSFPGHVGGIGQLVSLFLTQFYAVPLLGAFFPAILLVLLQQAVGRDSALSFLPSFLFMGLLLANNMHLCGLPGVCVAVWLAGWSHLASPKGIRIFLPPMAAIVLWWVFGYLAAGIFLLCLVLRFTFRRSAFRLPSYSTLISCLLLVVMALGASLLFSRKKENECFYRVATFYGRWQEILDRPIARGTIPIPVLNSVNLALGKTGALGQKAFLLPQQGTAGLLGRDSSDFWMNAQVLYHLGFDRQSRHYAESAFLHTRGADQGPFACLHRIRTASVGTSGRELAFDRQRISHTLFHKNWDSEPSPSVYLLDQHLVFEESRFDSMLRIMIGEHPQNTLALEYLKMYYLLSGQMAACIELLPKDRPLQTHYAEAVALYYTLRREDVATWPYLIDKDLADQTNVFINYYHLHPTPEEMRPFFGQTYWFYYTFEQ